MSYTHVVDGGVGRVLWSGVSEASAGGAGMRCRFGTVDVACTTPEVGTLCCLPPSHQMGDEKEVLLQVLNKHDACLAQEKFVYPAAEKKSCCGGRSSCGPALSAEPSGPLATVAISQRALLAPPAAAATSDDSWLAGLSWTDRLLPVWIIGAMVLGVVLGYYTNISAALDVVQIDHVSLPIAVGLWMMMWPVLCKVKYELLGGVLHDRVLLEQLVVSLTINWVVGPLLMTGLAWATLPDLPGYRNGIIMVGIARCIAMVLIWNQMSRGSPEYCAILVAVNSVMQIVLFAPLSIFYLKVVSRQFQGPNDQLHISFWQVLQSVLIYLGAPLVAGIVTRLLVLRVAGRDWFEKVFMAWFGPVALVALVYTIIVIFALQGHAVIAQIGDVCRVAVPMVLYFSIMWTGTIAVCRWRGFSYALTVTQAFTAASNNFELAIAIAVGTFGIHSQEALAATIGPLVEVPALLSLVYVALYLQKRLLWAAPEAGLPQAAAAEVEAAAVGKVGKATVAE